MKKTPMIVALVILLATSINSCKTAYQKIVTDTHRTDEERALLAKACHEEFPPQVRYIKGDTTRDTTIEYYDQSLLVDSLAVVTQDQSAQLQAQSDSINKLRKVAKMVITVHRVDTLKVSDSAEINRHVDIENGLREDLVKSHGETIEAGMERDQAKAGQKDAEDKVNFWRWYAILISVAFVCYIFRKPLLRGVIAIFNPIKI